MPEEEKARLKKEEEKLEKEQSAIAAARESVERRTAELGDVSELISEGASEIFSKAEQNDDLRRFFASKKKAEENEELTYTHTVALGSTPTALSKDLLYYRSKIDCERKASICDCILQ